MARLMLNTNLENNPQAENENPAPGAMQLENDIPVKTATPIVTASEAVKQVDAYANAFPEWDLVPPQILIRRVNRSKQ